MGTLIHRMISPCSTSYRDIGDGIFASTVSRTRPTLRSFVAKVLVAKESYKSHSSPSLTRTYRRLPSCVRTIYRRRRRYISPMEYIRTRIIRCKRIYPAYRNVDSPRAHYANARLDSASRRKNARNKSLFVTHSRNALEKRRRNSFSLCKRDQKGRRGARGTVMQMSRMHRPVFTLGTWGSHVCEVS